MTTDEMPPDANATVAFEKFVTDYVARGSTYVDAVIAYGEKNGIEPEDSKRLVMSSKPIYQNLTAECRTNKLIKSNPSVS